MPVCKNMFFSFTYYMFGTLVLNRSILNLLVWGHALMNKHHHMSTLNYKITSGKKLLSKQFWHQNLRCLVESSICTYTISLL